jgi:hypothetical protein
MLALAKGRCNGSFPPTIGQNKDDFADLWSIDPTPDLGRQWQPCRSRATKAVMAH